MLSTQYHAILCSCSFVDEILQTVMWQIIVRENLVSFSYFLRTFYLQFKSEECNSFDSSINSKVDCTNIVNEIFEIYLSNSI